MKVIIGWDYAEGQEYLIMDRRPGKYWSEEGRCVEADVDEESIQFIISAMENYEKAQEMLRRIHEDNYSSGVITT